MVYPSNAPLRVPVHCVCLHNLDKLAPIFIDHCLRPTRIRFRMLSVGQMDDRESTRAIQKLEQEIVTVLAMRYRSSLDATEYMAPANLAVQLLRSRIIGTAPDNRMPR